MKIVTGVGENPHVTSKEMRRIVECMSGQDSYIIDCGEQLKPELVSNNLLKIRNGSMVHHGNVSSVDPYDEIEITNGTQGMKRIDLIVNRYTKNAETQIETNEWVVIQGTPAASNPTVPKHTVGNLQDGDLVDDCPYIQITLDGINVTEIKQLLKVMPNIPDLVAENAERKKELTELNGNLKKHVKVADFEVDNITIKRNSIETIVFENTQRTDGYSRMIMTASVENASSNGSGSSFCFTYNTTLSYNTKHSAINVRNTHSEDIVVKAKCKVLYVNSTNTAF